MDYIIGIALFAGGGWTGYLLGQFSGIKEMNRRLNALVAEKRAVLGEMDRMADIIGKHQEKAHACAKCNQFASKRAAKTAELQAYVASKKAA